MTHIAYTLVAKGFVPTYEEYLDTKGRPYRSGHKWPGGWAFVSEATASAARDHLPEAAPLTSVRRIELNQPLSQVGTRHPEVPGCFLLTVFAKILPAEDKKPVPKKKPKKKAAAKRPKKVEHPSLFD